ncbi:RagB/SusD family nutrient uptake outer membrane protein [Fulvivirgaceae bacterium PWU4]|uniref:RagB/SusD family nutrient uptake outer membrane protein n=1 Tax=Chryseosolibacter histidini TaxID=2782349 RepID=A0AAP2GNE4_9BACT|nr:RagB/SusD family nutrient uptake outer membrane protein [Chryseosolibacter histidini]MBT1696427.1 RagB/SusD family nutrient uptake outer membrane protein [Chryseosolibacter histidini]
MKKYSIILFIAFALGSCEDFLDRPPLTQMNDETLWVNENNVRLYVNGFYPNYFVGYNSGFGVDYAPLRGYTFNDDLTSSGKQSGFETQAPASRNSLLETAAWLGTYSGPTWDFAWVRKSNLLLERVEKMKDTYLQEEPYKHWSAVARFFRGFEYSRLVSVFGNVPYYDHVLIETELDQLYKDRDDRTVVMDHVYDDFEYVMTNMRESDGNIQYLNRYIAAGFISRFMLFEGTYQKYHFGNTEKAKKYLDQAVRAADMVIKSGKWSFTSDFRSLFGSESLATNKEVLLYRTYDAALGVTHAIASYSNTTESQGPAANLDLIRSFIARDGQPYKLSAVPNADKLDVLTLQTTRDPRFEATFWDAVRTTSATLLYADKFIDRTGPTFAGSTYPPQYGSSTNTNDAPVLRLAEVALNLVEAKAELETMGGTALTQADIDVTINAIRNRPLDQAAIGKGVQKTAPLLLSAVPNDPDRDATVSPILWEIRRERRMEFVYEHTRLLDLKRWKKLDYMNAATNPDLLRGPWVDFNTELPSFLTGTAKVNILKVEKADGTVVTFNGTNKAEMVGYYVPENVSNRDAFNDRVYLAPLGNNEINQYEEKGYHLTQNPGWN